MATREDLGLIKAARQGDADSQLALGKKYLFGCKSLARNEQTALYWLTHSARQGVVEAGMLIAAFVPAEFVQTALPADEAVKWYELACHNQCKMAGIHFAQFVLGNEGSGELFRKRAIDAVIALGGNREPELQWLLSRLITIEKAKKCSEEQEADQAWPTNTVISHWVQEAANAGIKSAQHTHLKSLWSTSCKEFFSQAMPIAKEILGKFSRMLPALREGIRPPNTLLDEHECWLMVCLARLHKERGDSTSEIVRHMLELAAFSGSQEACFELGLYLARIDENGIRVPQGKVTTDYPAAVAWLHKAGQAGIVAAWFVLARIYLRPEFSRRDIATSRKYDEMAAEGGHIAAQYQCAQHVWRRRAGDAANEVIALYWWQKAAMQGHPESLKIIEQYCALSQTDHWGIKARERLCSNARTMYPFLTIRIELAIAFGLSKQEALLIDVNKANKGHCLVVDIMQYRPKTKRRLILVMEAQQKMVLNNACRLWEDIDCGYASPEGNYRQRLYRLDMLCRKGVRPGKG